MDCTGCGVIYVGCDVIYTGFGVTCNAGFGAGFRCVYHVDRRITAVAPAVAQAAGWTARAAVQASGQVSDASTMSIGV